MPLTSFYLRGVHETSILRTFLYFSLKHMAATAWFFFVWRKYFCIHFKVKTIFFRQDLTSCCSWYWLRTPYVDHVSLKFAEIHLSLPHEYGIKGMSVLQVEICLKFFLGIMSNGHINQWLKGFQREVWSFIWVQIARGDSYRLKDIKSKNVSLLVPMAAESKFMVDPVSSESPGLHTDAIFSPSKELLFSVL